MSHVPTVLKSDRSVFDKMLLVDDNANRDFANKMSHNKRCYVKKINKSAAQGSRKVDLMFKQAFLKAFTSD